MQLMDAAKCCSLSYVCGWPGKGQKKFLFIKTQTPKPLTVTVYKVETKQVSPKSLLILIFFLFLLFFLKQVLILQFRLASDLR